MQIGLHLNRYDWPGGPANTAARLAEIARTAEEAGFVNLSVMDHFFQIEGIGPLDDPVLEGYSCAITLCKTLVDLGLTASGLVYPNAHPKKWRRKKLF